MTRALVLLAALVLAGCAGGDETETTPGEVSVAKVYFLLDDDGEERVWPVAREIPEGADPASHVLDALADGPTSDEEGMGLTSAFPDGVEASLADGVATVESETELATAQLAQLVYSLTALEPVVQTVEFGGQSYTRADFEEQTPAILVESPLAFQDVGNPVVASGTANTFEANFQYELTDTDGRIVDDDFVTATSGTGTRGTFELTTAEYEIPFDGVGALIVFELSAEDGSRINLVEIPVRMSR